MLFFRSEEHVERWGRQWGLPRGVVLTPEQAWQLAEAWYGPDRRAPEWRRRTLEETEALFADLGLTGVFWNLRPSPSAA
jgi:hypothetical protein